MPAIPDLQRRSTLAALAFLGGTGLAGCTAFTPAPPPVAPPPAPGTLDAFAPMPAGPESGADAATFAAVRALGRGINFGNMLEAPTEGAWGVSVEDRFIALVGETGFTRTVRLPVRWSNHAGLDAQARIDPAFMARAESVVDRLLARGANVLLNMQHYRQFEGGALDEGERAVDPAVVDLRFFALWRQIAERFAGRGPRLWFELYNEPHGRLDPLWNELLSRALRLVRQSNPERLVVVGPTSWNSASALSKLRLPPDRRVVLTVHNYDPFNFTHQGAPWVKPTPALGLGCCDGPQQRTMLDALDLAVAQAQQRGYPIFVGEFGAFEKAPAAARVAYSRFMRDAIEQRGMPWMYWELASGFGVYDPVAGRFRADLFAALYG